jgi:hypothetical protein
MSLRHIFGVIGAVALIACKSNVTDGGGEGGAGGEEPMGGSIIVDGGSSSIGGGTAQGGSSNVCAGFEDDVPPPTVWTITVRNDAPADIYLPTSCGSIDLTLTPGVADGASYWYPSSCLQTCQELQTEGQILCEPCASSAYRLVPGASVDLYWSGLGLFQTEMPEECFLDASGFTSCVRERTAPAGPFMVQAWGSATCAESPNIPCTCDPETNLCWGYPEGADALAGAGFTFPSDSTIEVTFGPCTFGCPPD